MLLLLVLVMLALVRGTACHCSGRLLGRTRCTTRCWPCWSDGGDGRRALRGAAWLCVTHDFR